MKVSKPEKSWIFDFSVWAALGLLQKQIVESAHTVQQNMDAISVKGKEDVLIIVQVFSVDRVHDTVVKQAERFNSVEWRLNSILTQTKGETVSCSRFEYMKF